MESCSQNKLYDPIRRLWVAATPEEHVRQRLLQQMTQSLGFPPQLIAVEKSLRELPHLADAVGSLPDRRTDILCFAQGIHPRHPLFPLLLVECKQEAIDQAAVEQTIGYNYHVQARFIALASPEETRLGYLDAKTQRYTFLSFLPSYTQLLASVSHGS